LKVFQRFSKCATVAFHLLLRKLHEMKILLKSLFFLLYGLLLTNDITGQNIRMRLDSFFNTISKYNEINGNALITEKGVVLYRKSFGFADFKSKIKNSDSTEFSLASISKVFTSTAILQLRDRRKFNLDDRFVKFFPDFPYQGITIRNLLSHTSGLPDYQIYEEQINQNPGKVFTNNDVIPSLKKWNKPLEFNPGEKWEYSNTNFCLLALLVEKSSGLPFQKYIRRYIFEKAKMNSTYFFTELKRTQERKQAINYEYPFLFSDKLQNVDSLKKYKWRTYNASGFVGQGNITSTTADMLKFDNALYGEKLLKQSTLNEAFSPVKLNNGKINNATAGIGEASYGLGWFMMSDTSAGKIVWHTGGQPGALSIFIRNISKRQTVIMFDNTFNRSLYGNGVNVMAIMNSKDVIVRKKSLIRDYGQALVDKGVDAAFCKFQTLKADSMYYYFSENDMNELGLQLLYSGDFNNHNDMSLEVLKLNILLFPESFNTYDSYGEALARVGKTDEAIVMYKRSIELNSNNDGGKQALKLLENNKN
jgi:CubicO group peptidase (beta-lactamase class C family)